MAFIQPSAPQQAEILLQGEFHHPRGHADAVVSPLALGSGRLNLWRIGGLAGGLIYSVAFWALAYQGGMAVVAWISPDKPAELAAMTPASAPLP